MKKKPIILEVDRGKQLNFILLRYTYVDINEKKDWKKAEKIFEKRKF